MSNAHATGDGADAFAPAPPPHDVVVDTLSLDASHNNGLVERVARFRTFGEP